MTYRRVIPRDLFNEASLLKCLGRLYIVTENLAAVTIFHSENQPFAIDQDQADGSIWCSTVRIEIKGRRYVHRRPLNSREPWPLYVYPASGDEGDEIDVFDDDGNLSPDFKALIA